MNRDDFIPMPEQTPAQVKAHLDIVYHFTTPEDGSYVRAYMRMCREAIKGAEQCMRHHECTVMESGNIMGLYNYHTRDYDPYFGVWKLDTTR